MLIFLLPGLLVLVWALATIALWLWLRGPDLSPYDQPVWGQVGQRDLPSAGHENVLKRIRWMQKSSRALTFRGTLRKLRRAMDEVFGDRLIHAEVEPVDAGGVPAEWVLAPGADPDRRMLYVHGGAFLAGSPRSHRPLCADLSAELGVSVLSLDYRLLPEHSRRACLEDCRRGYRWILEHGPRGYGAPSALLLGGDSAGGNLALVTSAWSREAGLRRPPPP